MWGRLFSTFVVWLEGLDINNPSLGPLIKLFKFFGLWYPKRSKVKSVIVYIFIIFTVCYLVNIHLYLIFAFNYKKFVTYIQFSSLYLGVLKIINFLYYHSEWQEVFTTASKIERMAVKSERNANNSVTVKFRRYIYLVLIGFWFLALTANLSYMPIFLTREAFLVDYTKPNTDIENLYVVWLPVEERTVSGRYISLALQTIFTETTLIFVLLWDVLFLALMVFIIGQLKVIRERCIHIYDGKYNLYNLKNVKECHRHYFKLIKFQKVIDNLTSPVMFIYLLYITINFGTCIILIILHKENLPKLITTFEVLSVLMLQLLMFYYIGNEVIVQSMEVSYGTFESTWPEASAAEQKAVFMLGGSVRKRLSFHAGPYNEISLATFISILRTSYSFYTLLNK